MSRKGFARGLPLRRTLIVPGSSTTNRSFFSPGAEAMYDGDSNSPIGRSATPPAPLPVGLPAPAEPVPAIATVAASTTMAATDASRRAREIGFRAGDIGGIWATDSTPAALAGCGALPGRLEPVNRALERDDVDAAARVLAERAQLRDLDPEGAVVARLPARPGGEAAQLPEAEVGVEVAPVERTQIRVSHDVAARDGA